MRAVWAAYTNAAKAYPLRTNVATGGVITVAGDTMAQLVDKKNHRGGTAAPSPSAVESEGLDVKRSAAMLGWGTVVSGLVLWGSVVRPMRNFETFCHCPCWASSPRIVLFMCVCARARDCLCVCWTQHRYTLYHWFKFLDFLFPPERNTFLRVLAKVGVNQVRAHACVAIHTKYPNTDNWQICARQAGLALPLNGAFFGVSTARRHDLTVPSERAEYVPCHGLLSSH
jgi:hypothetical protein